MGQYSEASGSPMECRLRHEEDGSPGRTRTCDQSVNSRSLYQLSYRGTKSVVLVNLEGAEFKEKYESF